MQQGASPWRSPLLHLSGRYWPLHDRLRQQFIQHLYGIPIHACPLKVSGMIAPVSLGHSHVLKVQPAQLQRIAPSHLFNIKLSAQCLQTVVIGRAGKAQQHVWLQYFHFLPQDIEALKHPLINLLITSCPADTPQLHHVIVNPPQRSVARPFRQVISQVSIQIPKRR